MSENPQMQQEKLLNRFKIRTSETLYVHLEASIHNQSYLFCMLDVGPYAGSHSL